jgi:hypothetical protein
MANRKVPIHPVTREEFMRVTAHFRDTAVLLAKNSTPPLDEWAEIESAYYAAGDRLLDLADRLFPAYQPPKGTL